MPTRDVLLRHFCKMLLTVGIRSCTLLSLMYSSSYPCALVKSMKLDSAQCHSWSPSRQVFLIECCGDLEYVTYSITSNHEHVTPVICWLYGTVPCVTLCMKCLFKLQARVVSAPCLVGSWITDWFYMCPLVRTRPRGTIVEKKGKDTTSGLFKGIIGAATIYKGKFWCAKQSTCLHKCYAIHTVLVYFTEVCMCSEAPHTRLGCARLSVEFGYSS